MKKPELTGRLMKLEVAYANKLLGTDFKPKQVAELLERMRFGVKVSGGVLEVSVPAYRTDVLHPMDLVEDAAIAGGYDKFQPTLDGIQSVGAVAPYTAFASKVADFCVGL